LIPKVLADVWESLIAAIYLDGGWIAVRNTIGEIIKPFLHHFIKLFIIFIK
jgi:dsRNA-specific ribonuclease